MTESADLARYLDGEVQADALTPAERAEAERFERLVAVMDRRSVTLPGSVAAAVMRRVRAEPRTRRGRVWRWAFETRAVRLSPAVGALASAAVVAGLLLAGSMLGSRFSERAHGLTRFSYIAPGATSVAVTGDFASWDPQGIALQHRGDDVWTVDLELAPGLHHYAFVVDGRYWRSDPDGSQVDDGFGRENSIVLVPAGPAT